MQEEKPGSQVNTEAETRVYKQGRLRIAGGSQNQESSTEQIHPQSLWKDQPCPHPGCRLLASRAAREDISAALNHPVVVIWESGPRKLTGRVRKDGKGRKNDCSRIKIHRRQQKQTL